MICLNCESKEYKVIYSESYPCSHCGEDLVVEYCMCPDCSTLWRAIDGNIATESLVNTEDLMHMLTPLNQSVGINPDDLSAEDREMFNRIEEELNKYANVDGEALTMSDMVHKCIKCNSIVHESKPGYFECEECGFSWEVMDIG